MAGASLLTLLDDIATLLDDVAAMTKVAAHKTTGVLADDLALNAQQVAGVRAERELPVVWAVGVGSLRNKAILVPAALLISAVMPWLITPLLMLGGAFLCYEGAEKLWHLFAHWKFGAAEADHSHIQALADPAVDLVAFEREKIKGAIRTDFILSAEIIVITLGTVADAGFWSQLIVLAGVSVLMTVGVYGIVAAIVKMDDVGLYLSRKPSAGLQAVGGVLLVAAPKLMKLLSVVGTAAMFMVGGAILVHGVPVLHHLIGDSADAAAGVSYLPVLSMVVGELVTVLLNAFSGLVAGALLVAAHMGVERVRGSHE